MYSNHRFSTVFSGSCFLSHSSFPPCKSRSYNWVERLGRIPAPNKAEKNIWWKNMDPRWCKSMDLEYLLNHILSPIWTDAHLIEMHGVDARNIQQVHVLTYEEVESDVSVKPIWKLWCRALAIQHYNINANPSTPNGVFILQLSPLFWSNFYLKGSLQKWGIRVNGFNESGTFWPLVNSASRRDLPRGFPLIPHWLRLRLGCKGAMVRSTKGWEKNLKGSADFFLLTIMVGDGWKKDRFFREVRERNMWKYFLFVNSKMTHFFLFEMTMDKRQQLPALQVKSRGLLENDDFQI